MEDRNAGQKISAACVVAATFGVMVGLAGIDHGVFEILQGNVAPDNLMIAAISPAQRYWVYGEETALTIVPNFLVTGILAVIFGILVILWAVFFVHRRHGAGVLLLLCITLFLVGGGFAPIFMAILASLIATRINKPITWRRKVIHGSVSSFLAKIWLWCLIALVILFLISVEIAIFGWPLTAFFDAEASFDLLNTAAYLMLGLMILSVLTGLAHDVQQDAEKDVYAGGYLIHNPN